ncbi:hypothetical protein D9M68_671820 [compost metagenome]
MGLERGEGQADLELRAAVGRDETAFGRKHRDALHQGAQELGAGVEVDADRLREDVGEHVVLDHLRRHAHQRQRVLVKAAVVARDVERADHLAVGVENGRGRAGEELVGIQVVLVAVHRERFLLGERGADGVGAFGLLGPVHAGRERHARGFFQKVGVAQRVQHHAACRGQQHHAVGVDDLVVQRLHHGGGVLEEKAVFVQRVVQHAARRAGEVGFGLRRDAIGLRTLVGLADQVGVRGGASWRSPDASFVGARVDACTHVVSRVGRKSPPVVHGPGRIARGQEGCCLVCVLLVLAHVILFISVP